MPWPPILRSILYGLAAYLSLGGSAVSAQAIQEPIGSPVGPLAGEALWKWVQEVAAEERRPYPRLKKLSIRSWQDPALHGRVARVDLPKVSVMAFLALSSKDLGEDEWDQLISCLPREELILNRPAMVTVQRPSQSSYLAALARLWPQERVEAVLSGLESSDIQRISTAARELFVALPLFRGLPLPVIPGEEKRERQQRWMAARTRLVAVLGRALTRSDRHLRSRLMLVLYHLPFWDSSFDAPLREALQSENPRLRRYALLASLQSGLDRKTLLPIALGAMTSKDKKLSGVGLIALSRFSHGLSQEQGDLVTPYAFDALALGDEVVVTAALKLLSEMPYDKVNPAPLGWEKKLSPILSYASTNLAATVVLVVLHRLPDSVEGNRLMVDACLMHNDWLHYASAMALLRTEIQPGSATLVDRLLRDPRPWSRTAGLQLLRRLRHGVLPLRYTHTVLDMEEEDRHIVMRQAIDLNRHAIFLPRALYLDELIHAPYLLAKVEDRLREYAEDDLPPWQVPAARVLRHFGKLEPDPDDKDPITLPAAWILTVEPAKKVTVLSGLRIRGGTLLAWPRGKIHKSWLAERSKLLASAKKAEGFSMRKKVGWHQHEINARIMRRIIASLDRKR